MKRNGVISASAPVETGSHGSWWLQFFCAQAQTTFLGAKVRTAAALPETAPARSTPMRLTEGPIYERVPKVMKDKPCVVRYAAQCRSIDTEVTNQTLGFPPSRDGQYRRPPISRPAKSYSSTRHQPPRPVRKRCCSPQPLLAVAAPRARDQPAGILHSSRYSLNRLSYVPINCQTALEAFLPRRMGLAVA